jgi:hypothetical protein
LFPLCCLACSNRPLKSLIFARGGEQLLIGGSPDLPQVIGSGETEYSSIFGGGNLGGNSSTTIPRATGLFPYDLEASNYTNHVTGTDMSGLGAATFTLLKNGSASGLAVSSSAGETGYIADNLSVVDFAVGDTCANMIAVTSGTGSSISWANAALLLEAS